MIRVINFKPLANISKDPNSKTGALSQPTIRGQIKLISNVIPAKAGIQWF